jgi:TRAP-type C4-dicarboxylate transport system permease small subunit
MRRALYAAVIKVEDLLPGLILLFVVLMVTLDVFARYFFSSPIRGVAELSLIGMTWLIMLGSARAVRTYQHIAVQALLDQLAGRAYAVVALLTTVFVIAVLAVVFFVATPYIFETVARVFPILGVSRFTITLAVPVGTGLMILHYIEDVVRLITDLRDGGSRYSQQVAFKKNQEFEALMAGAGNSDAGEPSP